jgi:predicted nucleic acid-binding protein
MRDFVSDTGPLISFEKIADGFILLRHLVDTIIISQAVYEELAAGIPPGNDYLAYFGIADFVTVCPVPAALPGTEGLHEGERSAIALAAQRDLPLLIEERAGHAVAAGLGLIPISASGLILHAYQAGHLARAEAERDFRALCAGRRINHDLLEILLRRLYSN